MKISEIKKTPDLVNESDPLKFGKRRFLDSGKRLCKNCRGYCKT